MVRSTPWFLPLKKMWERANSTAKYFVVRWVFNYVHRQFRGWSKDEMRRALVETWSAKPPFDSAEAMRSVLGKRATVQDNVMLNIIESIEKSYRERMN